MRVAILTLSDSRSLAEDLSGQGLVDYLAAWPDVELVERALLPDERDQIEAALIRCVDDLACALVLTTGGTGLAPRDVTPEATEAVSDRLVPGLAERMRQLSLQKTPLAALSRAVVGQRGRSLIVNLPGSPRGARECLEAIAAVLPHALAIAGGERPH
ncbi:MAG: MogA/MoaB family molybdenum cofactor biosynthesis protein [Candidatus Sericytochromatia bacterium]|nr:MogA/MoaB family molybdenum cofactor biosynthesis protein [Candidatus Sericytochromatia bacterium]